MLHFAGGRRAVVAVILIDLLLLHLRGCGAQQRRAAGGRGPELRSRVTQALDQIQAALQADPGNGGLWWRLGVQAQVAAGGFVEEERLAASMLERAIVLDPSLGRKYENLMTLGDMLRGSADSSTLLRLSDAQALFRVEGTYPWADAVAT
jgi:cytochrome c-type biogenesis protein CcmH/NrfG